MISQKTFAEIMEVTRQAVTRWELDQSYPAMDKLVDIANFFHVSLDELLRNNPEQENNFQKRKNIGGHFLEQLRKTKVNKSYTKDRVRSFIRQILILIILLCLVLFMPFILIFIHLVTFPFGEPVTYLATSIVGNLYTPISIKKIASNDYINGILCSYFITRI